MFGVTAMFGVFLNAPTLPPGVFYANLMDST